MLDKKIDDIVIVVSFLPFIMMSEQKYEEFEDLTKTFWKTKIS
jgi:hypothetical protein